jgi:hypothetical protein
MFRYFLFFLFSSSGALTMTYIYTLLYTTFQFMTHFPYQRTITYMYSASMLPQAFSRSNSNPSHQRNRLLFTCSSMLQLPSCSRLRVYHRQDIDCTYNMNVHGAQWQSTHPRANIQPHPLSKQNRLVPEHLTPAAETTPVTRVDWPTVLQRKANHNSF